MLTSPSPLPAPAAQTVYPGINKPVAVADWLANTEVSAPMQLPFNHVQPRALVSVRHDCSLGRRFRLRMLLRCSVS